VSRVRLGAHAFAAFEQDREGALPAKITIDAEPRQHRGVLVVGHTDVRTRKAERFDQAAPEIFAERFAGE
jgi:hypothetical protein